MQVPKIFSIPAAKLRKLLMGLAMLTAESLAIIMLVVIRFLKFSLYIAEMALAQIAKFADYVIFSGLSFIFNKLRLQTLSNFFQSRSSTFHTVVDMTFSLVNKGLTFPIHFLLTRPLGLLSSYLERSYEQKQPWAVKRLINRISQIVSEVKTGLRLGLAFKSAFVQVEEATLSVAQKRLHREIRDQLQQAIKTTNFSKIFADIYDFSFETQSQFNHFAATTFWKKIPVPQLAIAKDEHKELSSDITGNLMVLPFYIKMLNSESPTNKYYVDFFEACKLLQDEAIHPITGEKLTASDFNFDQDKFDTVTNLKERLEAPILAQEAEEQRLQEQQRIAQAAEAQLRLQEEQRLAQEAEAQHRLQEQQRIAQAAEAQRILQEQQHLAQVEAVRLAAEHREKSKHNIAMLTFLVKIETAIRNNNFTQVWTNIATFDKYKDNFKDLPSFKYLPSNFWAGISPELLQLYTHGTKEFKSNFSNTLMCVPVYLTLADNSRFYMDLFEALQLLNSDHPAHPLDHTVPIDSSRFTFDNDIFARINVFRNNLFQESNEDIYTESQFDHALTLAIEQNDLSMFFAGLEQLYGVAEGSALIKFTVAMEQQIAKSKLAPQKHWEGKLTEEEQRAIVARYPHLKCTYSDTLMSVPVQFKCKLSANYDPPENITVTDDGEVIFNFDLFELLEKMSTSLGPFEPATGYKIFDLPQLSFSPDKYAAIQTAVLEVKLIDQFRKAMQSNKLTEFLTCLHSNFNETNFPFLPEMQAELEMNEDTFWKGCQATVRQFIQNSNRHLLCGLSQKLPRHPVYIEDEFGTKHCYELVVLLQELKRTNGILNGLVINLQDIKEHTEFKDRIDAILTPQSISTAEKTIAREKALLRFAAPVALQVLPPAQPNLVQGQIANNRHSPDI